MPYQISDLAQATDVTASLASREIELGGLGLGAFRLSLSNLRKALLLGAVSLGFNATDPLTVGATTVTTLQTSGIAGFGQAPEANNAVAVRGATSDNTSNIFLGRNAAAVVKFAIDSTGLITTFGGLTVSSGATSLQAVTATTLTLGGTTAAAGLIRLPNQNTISWRSAANNDDFRLWVNFSNVLVFDNASAGTPQAISVGAITAASGLTVSAGGITVTGTGLFNGDLKAHNVGILGSGGDYGSIGYGSTSTVVGTVYTYASNDFASRIEFTSGGFKFFTAPVGTVGNNITFTQRGWMTQDGIFMWGTGVSSGSGPGWIILANSTPLAGVTGAGSAVVPLIQIDSANVVQIGLTSSGVYAGIGGRPAVSLDGAAANRNGIITTDTTNNRLVYYQGGNRYWLFGTAF